MEVLNDILGYKNRKIYQDTDYFSFSLDSIMLANFATIRLRDRLICDLGCGNGVIPLILSLRTNKNIVGVEIQKKLSDMAIKSVDLNKLSDQIKIINIDMKKFVNSEYFESFDLITCNPPYFKVNDKSFFNESYEKMIARHEIEINLSELLLVVNKLLKNNGNFAIVHRPERLMEILFEFRKNHIEPKRIQFVYEKASKGSTLVLIEGQKNGKDGLKIENPIIMYNEDGSFTDEYELLQNEVR
ncbi:MAG: tRNA1(Val) (adenine(37)-N6)-methyltransferase [Bacilli bacterium]|nr:tRNA1(Val) (adenine(37)-N6)-methyltransferase [Bacilli bacterium]